MAQKLGLLRKAIESLRSDSTDYRQLRRAVLSLVPMPEQESPTAHIELGQLHAEGFLNDEQLSELLELTGHNKNYQVDDATRLAQEDPSAGSDADEPQQALDSVDEGTVLAGHSVIGESGATVVDESSADSAPPRSALPPTEIIPDRSGASSGSALPLSPSTGVDQPLTVGSVVAQRFVLEKLVGKGGMGLVYLARDMRWVEADDRNPHVAIKILSEEFKRHPESVKALQRESRKSQTLAHPNIVNVYNFDRDGSTVFMTMEFLDGLPLNEVIASREKPFEPATALRYIRQMAVALKYAHDHNIVHSDFKPGNAFLTKRDVIKVLDFGIARASKVGNDALGGSNTTTHFDAGDLGALTPAYASLEMFLGADPAPSDDIYALGCVAFELLTGRHPYGRTPASTIVKHPPKLQPIQGLKRRQWQTLHKSVALRREDRLHDIDELLAGLDLEARNSRALRIASLASAGVVSIILIGFVTNNELEQRRIDRLRTALQSSDGPRISAALVEVNELEATQRGGLLREARIELTQYFVAQAHTTFDLENAKYNYPSAVEWLNRANEYYEDSERIVSAREQLLDGKNNFLNELDVKFTNALSRGRLLPTSGRDSVDELLSIVGQVDPNHPMMSDPRLRLAYLKASGDALAVGDIANARTLILAGTARFPEDDALATELALVVSEEERAEQQAAIALVEGRLIAARSAIQSLAGLDSLREDVKTLEQIAPRSIELTRIRELGYELIQSDVGAAAAQRQWTEANGTIERYGDFLEPGDRIALGDSVMQAQADWRLAIGNLMDQAIAASKSSELTSAQSPAQRILQALTDLGANATDQNQAKEALAQGFLEQSRLVRSRQDWAAADVVLNVAKQTLGEYGSERFERELFEIRRARSAAVELAQRQQLEEEQRQTLTRLQADFETTVGASPLARESIRTTLAIIDEMSAVDPGGTAGRRNRERLVAAIVEQSGELRRAQNFDEARSLVNVSIQALPQSVPLQAELERVSQDAVAYEEQQRVASITETKAQLDALLAQPDLDIAWETQFDAKFNQLRLQGGADADYESATRTRVARLFLAQLDQELTQARYVSARDYLRRGRRYAPTLEEWELSGTRINQREEEGRSLLALEQRDARLTGLKQTFQTQLNALDIDRAEKTLQEIRRLAPSDQFVTNRAPGLLATAYQRSAQRAISFQNYDSAIDLATAGLRHSPSDPKLLETIESAKFEQAANVIRNHFSDVGAMSESDLQRQIAQLRSAGVQNLPVRLNELSGDLVNSIRRVAQEDFGFALLLQRQAQTSFPTSEKVRGLDLEAEQQSQQQVNVRKEQIAALLVKAKQAEQSGRLIADTADGAIGLYRAALKLDAENNEANGALNRISDAYIERANDQLDQGDTEAVVSSLRILESIGRAARQVASLKVRRLEVQAFVEEQGRRREFERYLDLARQEVEESPLSKTKLAGAVERISQARQMFPNDTKLMEVAAIVTESYGTLAGEYMKDSKFDDASEVVEAGLSFERDSQLLVRLQDEIQQQSRKKKRPKKVFMSF